MAYGPIVNMTTGRFTSYAAYGNPGDNGFPFNGGGNLIVYYRHRKKYVFSAYEAFYNGSSIFI